MLMGKGKNFSGVHVQVYICVWERERERKRESGGKLRLQQHMLSIQKTYTVPLVNKVLGMPLGSNLDCDLRRCRGFVCGWACLEVCVLCIWAFFLDAPLKQYSGGSGWPSCTPPHLCPHFLSLSSSTPLTAASEPASADLASAANPITTVCRTQPQPFEVFQTRNQHLCWLVIFS